MKYVIHLGLSIYNVHNSFPLSGIPEDGHKEKRGTAKTSQGEIWNKYRPTKIDRTIVTSSSTYGVFFFTVFDMYSLVLYCLVRFQASSTHWFCT